MAERVILISIPEASRHMQVTRVLSQIHNLTAGVIQDQLKNLPWVLPEISDFKQRENIVSSLEQLGCVVERKYEEEEKTSPAETEPVAAPSKPESKIIESKLTETSGSSSPRFPQKLPHEEEVSFQVKKKKKAGWKKPSLVTIAILLLIGFFVWLGSRQDDYGVRSEMRKQKPAARTTQQKKYPVAKPQKSVLNKAKASPDYLKKKKAESFARKYLKKAGEETLPQQKSQYLQKALDHNPYNTQAWKELIKILKKQKLHKQEQIARQQSYEKNEKVRKVLHSIAERFGRVRLPLELSPSEFKFDIKVSPEQWENIQEHGFRFYRQIQQIHGDKHLSAFLYSTPEERYHMEVPADKAPMDREEFLQYFRKVER